MFGHKKSSPTDKTAESPNLNSSTPNDTPAPPYTAAPEPSKPQTSYMASGSSAWNTSGWAFPASTNVLDESTMPSDKAAAARAKAAMVMAALKNGAPGEADAVMGEDSQRATQGVLPLKWLGRKPSSGASGLDDVRWSKHDVLALNLQALKAPSLTYAPFEQAPDLTLKWCKNQIVRLTSMRPQKPNVSDVS